MKRSFVATASRMVRPNTVYRVNVIVLPQSEGMIVKALITKDGGQHIASAVDIVDSVTSHNLLMKVFLIKIHYLWFNVVHFILKFAYV